jgi:hypothetical protein
MSEHSSVNRQSSFLLTLDKLERSLRPDDVNTTRLVRVAHTITLVGNMHHLRPEGRTDELTTTIAILASLSTELLQHLSNCSSILRVEIGVDFVEEVERCRVALLNREDECECTKGLLTPRKLGDALLLVVFRIERHSNGNTCILCNLASLLCLSLFLVLSSALIAGATSYIGI